MPINFFLYKYKFNTSNLNTFIHNKINRIIVNILKYKGVQYMKVVVNYETEKNKSLPLNFILIIKIKI